MFSNRVILHMLAVGATATLLTGFSSRDAFALTYDELVEQAYEKLVTEKENEFMFRYDGNMEEDFYKLAKELKHIDKDDNLYDGIMLDSRGDITLYSYKNNEDVYKISVNSAYKVDDAEALTDKMVEEIKKDLPKDSTDKEKFYSTVNYIKSIYKYDYEEYYGDGNFKNFVEAYYNGEGKVSCKGFSSVLYILSKKMGLDAVVFEGKRHVFNGIRFDDGKYMAIDLSTASHPMGVMLITENVFAGHRGEMDSIKRYATIPEYLSAIGYSLTH